MRKLLFILFFTLLPLFASAQQFKFGYFSYSEVLHSMPDYVQAEHSLAELRGKYEAESKRAEAEFNHKYEEFLDGQKDFAPSILEKRQSELRELMEKSIAFKEQAQRLLAQAEKEAHAPQHARLKSVLARLANQRGYALVLNTDNNTVPFINLLAGDDLTTTLKTALKSN